MTEAQHQVTVFKWAAQPSVRKEHPELKLLFHIPNGGSRDAIEGKHLKAQGVKSGVPDLFLPVPRCGYHGLWIEMKTDTGKPTLEQEWWGYELHEQSYIWEVCHGWESAVRTLQWYLNLKKQP